MIYPALGFWLIFDTPLFDSDRASRVAELLTDPRWPWQPALIRPSQTPDAPLYPWPRGKVAAKALRPMIEDVLRSTSATKIHLAMSRKDAGDQAWAIVSNGSPGSPIGNAVVPYTAVGLCRYPFPETQTIDGWLALVRDLAGVLRAVHGVICVETDERFLMARQFVMGSRDPRQPPDFPSNESHRINHVRNKLGDRYVRFPGWATFLRPAHVDAIGGREKLLAVVKPPVVHEVGDLLYVQLSASVDDAHAPETEARRQAFIDLLAPILVPEPQP